MRGVGGWGTGSACGVQIGEGTGVRGNASVTARLPQVYVKLDPGFWVPDLVWPQNHPCNIGAITSPPSVEEFPLEPLSPRLLLPKPPRFCERSAGLSTSSQLALHALGKLHKAWIMKEGSGEEGNACFHKWTMSPPGRLQMGKKKPSHYHVTYTRKKVPAKGQGTREENLRGILEEATFDVSFLVSSTIIMPSFSSSALAERMGPMPAVPSPSSVLHVLKLSPKLVTCGHPGICLTASWVGAFISWLPSLLA
ncbi:PREDICTED: uncharacterized protein LOC105585662 isoform X2 [Cercocebus atys]|uniref:uncharacterized protein LOC105585662 isoform X2 n=1 Tax=Cercocebus atys TaxID=9531 RepID=UPI0005F3ADD5|nr:PREDICTED: uncharacterized protein LOC105585662 isoform X2 [Cercocebus atys]